MTLNILFFIVNRSWYMYLIRFEFNPYHVIRALYSLFLSVCIPIVRDRKTYCVHFLVQITFIRHLIRERKIRLTLLLINTLPCTSPDSRKGYATMAFMRLRNMQCVYFHKKDILCKDFQDNQAICIFTCQESFSFFSLFRGKRLKTNLK